jgi:hypothetical protein
LVLVCALATANFIPCAHATPGVPLPFVSVQASGPLASEPGGNPGTFTISRADGATSALTLSFTLGGTATNGIDYSEVPTNVTFAAGQTSTNIAIVPITEPQASLYKTVILNLRRDAMSYPPALPSFIVGSMNRAVVYIVYNYTNVAPKVAWLTPTNGASFLSRPNVELAVNASDSNGWVTAVSFLANGQHVGTVTNNAFPGGWAQSLSSPETHGVPFPISAERRREFQFVWTNVPPGIYALTAVATDNAGLQTTSDSVQFTVTTNLPAPRAQIVNPPKGANFPDNAGINIYAAAGESGGVVNTVEFLANGASLGVETNYFATQPSSQFHLSFQWLPYNFRWTNASEGSNVLTVIATDNNGTMATSAPVTINVTTNTYHHHHN